MGCSQSTSDHEPDAATAEADKFEDAIEQAMLQYEARLEPLRVEIQKAKDAYKLKLAETTNKRMDAHARGQDVRVAPRRDVMDCEAVVKDAEKV